MKALPWLMFIKFLFLFISFSCTLHIVLGYCCYNVMTYNTTQIQTATKCAFLYKFFKNNNHFTAKTTANKGRDMRHEARMRRNRKDRMRELAHNPSVVLCPVFFAFCFSLKWFKWSFRIFNFVILSRGWEVCWGASWFVDFENWVLNIRKLLLRGYPTL